MQQYGNTPVHYAEDVRFRRPALPVFGVGGALLSAASLALMTAVAWLLLRRLSCPGVASPDVLPGFLARPRGAEELPLWVWLPFAFTVFGAGVGFLLEVGLLLAGTPFRTARNRFTRFVASVRLLNLAPVAASIFFVFVCVVVPYADLRLALLYAVVVLGVGVGFGLFFGGAEVGTALTIMGAQALQIVMVLASDVPGDAAAVRWFLVAQSVLQIAALLVGTATPLRSTGFHVLSTLSAAALYGALRTIVDADPGYAARVAVHVPLGSLAFWGMIALVLGTLGSLPRTLPASFARFRAWASDAVWSWPNFLLVSNPRFPNPVRLNVVYDGIRPAPIGVKPYYQVHPTNLVQSLAVLEAMRLPETVTVHAQLVKLVRAIFRVITPVDQYFPQADVRVPIERKPRMEIWSDGREYWPTLFRKRVFGRTIPGAGELEPTPEPAVEAFKRGQLLAYLCESGIGSTLVRAERKGKGLVLDLRFLETYETKADYESYGGLARFVLDEDAECLRLVSVIAPHTTVVVAANPTDPTFRYAEGLIVASLYFYVVSGKHLAEIHMSYALVEVALHNAFDAKGQWAHPFRTFLYLHLFSHGLAETLTTEHLVQEGAVFAQIFATSGDGLIRHLNDCWTDFQYGDDEDFEGRADLMRMRKNDKLLPRCAIRWERKYARIWQRYTTKLIDAIYADDEAVRADGALQGFHDDLRGVLLNPLPERYAGFRTKAGVARYAADTIHHLVVRHQVYGTTSVKAALDPRISKTQVPRDTGTTPVDEWRSLASVALATARARFTLLFGDFKYLFDDVHPRYRDRMRDAFDELQEDLRVLDAKWSKSDAERQFNYDYFRPLPSELHTGAGY